MSEARKLMADSIAALDKRRRNLQKEMAKFRAIVDELLSDKLSVICTFSEPSIANDAREAMMNCLERKRRSVESELIDSAKPASTSTCTLNDAGIQKEILQDGEGAFLPSSGSIVKIHYTAYLLDGTKFDSTTDRGVPLRFTVGDGKVTKALEIAVTTMRKGEIAMFICTAKSSFGITGIPTNNRPPVGFVKFEVKMIDFTGKDVSPDLCDAIEMFQIAADQSHPAIGSIVDVHLIGKYNNKVFEERDVTFQLGKGAESGVIKGVEIGLEKMCSKSKTIFKIKSRHAFEKTGKPEFGVPPDAQVEYTVHLKNFEKYGRMGSGGRGQEAEMRPPSRRRT